MVAKRLIPITAVTVLIWVGVGLSQISQLAPRDRELTWDSHLKVATAPRRGGLDVTLFITADTHLGYERDVTRYDRAKQKEVTTRFRLWPHQKKMVAAMNGVVGKPWPKGTFSGKVAPPKALFVAGDLTEDGRRSHWQLFERLFGTGRKGGLFKYPVHVSVGNHDLRHNLVVLAKVVEREGSYRYVKEYGDLAVIMLGLAPFQGDLKWLMHQLAALGRSRPVVILFHYPLAGPLIPETFRSGTYRKSLANIIKGFNVIALIHGHFHVSGLYRFHSTWAYNVGSIKHSSRDFAVLRVTDRRLELAFYNYELGRWWWYHTRPINGHKGPSTLKKLHPKPFVPYPKSWLTY